MKLQQLRFLVAIAKHGLNISEAAEHLHTSQPGVSKQLKLLEEELGLELFTRSGKHLSRITPAGQQIIARAEVILNEVANIKRLAQEFRNERQGRLDIATTHTQARYTLPEAVKLFREEYPEVELHFHQGTPRLISEMAVSGDVDFAVATEALALYRDLVMMPAYRWNRCVVVPPGHPLTRLERLTLEALAEQPIVTYVEGLTGRGQMDRAFEAAGLKPNLVFTATDADVIKTYVRLGLGVGVIARMAYVEALDADLVKIDAGHLFEPSVTKIAFRRGTYLRRYMYRFMELFAPHLTRERVDAAARCRSQQEVDALFADVVLPER
ncbi:MAG: CysB family transcriptional regulator [Gammaproteobacteria bacterium]|nr:MAG: CysB family transcriptional regulator [Gammaproteobacteria bacterium]